jgi:all-trans-retinol dehydrogenase (NAD+)
MKYLGKNITCTTICPYFINTGMFNGTVPRISPLLDQNYVAHRIVTAILQEEEEVSLPWWMGTASHLLKGFFPSMGHDYVSNIILGGEALSGLHGRPEPKL